QHRPCSSDRLQAEFERLAGVVSGPGEEVTSLLLELVPGYGLAPRVAVPIVDPSPESVAPSEPPDRRRRLNPGPAARPVAPAPGTSRDTRATRRRRGSEEIEGVWGRLAAYAFKGREG